MKSFKDIFKYSLRLPERQSAFKLNRIGMDKIIIYLFFLIAIASVPGLIDQLKTNVESATFYVQTFFFLIFFFIFYYLVFVCVLFALLSSIAYIGSWIARGTNRKVRYSILWKMAACILTIPLLLFTVISFFYPLSTWFLGIIFIYHFFVFIQTIFLYPKRKQR